MKNTFNAKLILTNPFRERNNLKIMLDTDGDTDFIGFSISDNDENLSLCNKDNIGKGDDEYFHLNRGQVGHLIDYLKRVYKNMDDDISEQHSPITTNPCTLR
eukprot:TRINITY_DN17915_c0_g1_i1.p1 TRINITY_DN17915_c0_g1~~TRINITY_DN17915_c0_g1_i1.p1  ORF type:complete len:102 (+),score=7.01 TRINITY_DN17915_c0_g1_i1:296-601(+)